MKGKDPRDAHFITSRICGICGDNHATCSVLRAEHGLRREAAALGEWIINLGEAAEYMFDHNIFQDNLVGVDFCEQMVKETNPGVWAKAKAPRRRTPASTATRPSATSCRAQPVHRRVLPRGAAGEPHDARDVLPDGRAPRAPVDAVSRRRRHGGHRAAVHRLPHPADAYVEFMKKVVPLHDDLFDFFYEALPGYEEVGRRRILLGCWGSFNDPEYCDLQLQEHDRLGPQDVRHPGVVVDGKLVTNDLVEINLGIRILLGSSYYDDWEDAGDVRRPGPAGQSGRPRHPWNQHTIPKPQKRDFDGNYSWVMSPRWFDKRTGRPLALDTGGGPIARLWARRWPGWSTSAT
jgi:hydrogenase large subunit